MYSFFFKQKTAYEMRISDWSSDVCSSDLQRLGFDKPPAPTLDTLRQLQRRHTAEFPFETLSTLLGQPVPIDLKSVERKVFEQGRGGYCYEQIGRASCRERVCQYV